MSRTRALGSIAVLVLMLPAAARAQEPAPQPAAPPPAVPGARPMSHAELRRHIYTMEGALAAAVNYGAKDLNRKIRSAMPEVMALSGEPQARGVYLEGYGIYFDVSVPVLNQVMVWTLKTMLGPDEGVLTALTQLRSYIESEKDVSRRAALENWMAAVEAQLGAVPGAALSQQNRFPPPVRQSGTVGASMLTPGAAESVAAAPERPTIDRQYLQDPNALNREYTESVQNALIDAIIDYAKPNAIKPNEYLTIGAREHAPRDTFAPPDPYEEVITLLLRIKGSDLAAYRAGQIDAAEVRRRVEIREF